MRFSLFAAAVLHLLLVPSSANQIRGTNSQSLNHGTEDIRITRHFDSNGYFSLDTFIEGERSRFPFSGLTAEEAAEERRLISATDLCNSHSTTEKEGLDNKIACCQLACNAFVISDGDVSSNNFNDVLYWSQKLTGIGGYCGEYIPFECTSDDRCTNNEEGMFTRYDNMFVDFKSLCEAKCSAAYPYYPFECEDANIKFDPGTNKTDPELQWYRDCTAECTPGENAFELTCNSGKMFDTACEAKCFNPDAPYEKAVKDQTTDKGLSNPLGDGSRTGMFTCPKKCALTATRHGLNVIHALVRRFMDLQTQLSEFQLKLAAIGKFFELFEEVCVGIDKPKKANDIAQAGLKVLTRVPYVEIAARAVLLGSDAVEKSLTPIQKAAKKSLTALKKLNKNTLEPMNRVIEKTMNKTDDVMMVFMIAGSFFESVLDCIEGSQDICEQTELTTSLDDYTFGVVTPTAEVMFAIIDKAVSGLEDLNFHTGRSISEINGLKFTEIKKTLDEIERGLDKWFPFIDKMGRVLKKKIYKKWTVQKIFDTAGKGLGFLSDWAMRGAKKIMRKIGVPEIKIFDDEVFAAFDVSPTDMLPRKLQSKDELNEALGLNFQQMDRLELNFTFIESFDGTCKDVTKIMQAVRVNPALDPVEQASRIQEARNTMRQTIDAQIVGPLPMLVAEQILDLTMSLAKSAKMYAEDGFDAFEEVSDCLFLPFWEGVECFGLDTKYIDRLIDIADRARGSANSVSISAFAVVVAGAVAVGVNFM